MLPPKLNHSIAHRVLLPVAKHIDAHHGGKAVTQLPKHHPQHHRVSQKGFVGQEFDGVVGPFGLFIFPLFDADSCGKDACTVPGEAKLLSILLPIE